MSPVVGTWVRKTDRRAVPNNPITICSGFLDIHESVMGMIRFPFSLPFLVVAMMSAASSTALAQGSPAPAVPRILFYQGILADMADAPVPDGEYVVTMRLYDTPEGGKALWEEPLKVGVDQGMFETYLGMSTALELPFDRPYWLAAQMQGEPEMTPRTLLVSAPYAFHSIRADRAAGLAPGASGAVTRLNGAQGELTIVGAEGIQVNRSGDTITILGNRVSAGGTASAASEVGGEKSGAQKVVQTSEVNGVITLALGGRDLATRPPVAGSFQHLGTIVVKNPHATGRSIVHVNVLEKGDDGTAPSPEAGLYLVDVDNRSEGSFTLHVGMIPAITHSSNFQQGDSISIGYTIVNSSR